MKRIQGYLLLARQLMANESFAIRRAVVEVAALALARLEPALPGAARLALRLNPH